MPLAVLLSWLLNSHTPSAILYSAITTPVVTLWLRHAMQSVNGLHKWPAEQWIGAGTILLSVVILCSPLLYFLTPGIVGAIALLIWILLCVYGAFAATRIHNKNLSITSAKLNRQYRFVQLSDLHAGSRSNKFIRKAVEQAKSHQPEAVFITGDLLDSSSVDQHTLQPLAEFECPVYMCIGNHERYVDLPAAIRSIEHNRVEVLRDSSQYFESLNIIGIDDADDRQQVAKQLPIISTDSTHYQILLYHKPDGWIHACDHGIDLMLAGHTHGGQIWPFGYLVKLRFKEFLGHYQRDNCHLYVSPGTGTWGPTLRLGTRCEMTILDLAPAA
ncbi:hypothetical protein AB833_05360 [Chromatiales bacterium (ex Bugula neritina AB1)]|nr:hypothetical protein AB833_05360 [Chromatiales bacterium (ex Bugula neritina AB1)]